MDKLNLEETDMSEQKNTINADESPKADSVRLSAGLGRIIIFAIYSVLFEMIIWGMFGWAVFEKGYSGWWMVLAVMMSSSQLKPKHFGIGNDDAKRN